VWLIREFKELLILKWMRFCLVSFLFFILLSTIVRYILG